MRCGKQLFKKRNQMSTEPVLNVVKCFSVILKLQPFNKIFVEILHILFPSYFEIEHYG